MPAEPASDVKLEIGHVLFIDIVGYSKLLINEQSEQLETLKKIARGTEQFRLAEAEGKLLRLPTGDGGALVFRTNPEAPVLCASEISRALKNHPELRVRMGIHSGPVNEIIDLNEQANIAGAGINIAQRVMDCGDAGHILLSKHVADDLEHYPRWRPYLHELGECEVKHGARVGVVNFYGEEIGNPQVPRQLKVFRKHRVRTRSAAIAAALLLLIGAVTAFVIVSKKSAQSISSIPEKSIAVLPFVDLSQAHDQEYFCDGISEEILDALAKVEGLCVVARTSSFSFKGKNANVSEIAQKLNVQNVLEGSLRREGNRIRVTAQLINARDGFHIWSDTFERELQSVFAVQDEITQAIVDALKVKLAVAPPTHVQQNTEAYDLYLQGLFYSNKSSEEDLQKALVFFHRALDIDPAFGRAWTGVAKTWVWLADAYVKPLEAFPKVKEAATKAITLDERDAEAHVHLGGTKGVLDWDPVGEEKELKRALQLDPNSVSARLSLAYLRLCQGDVETELTLMAEAKKLDPLSAMVSRFVSWGYLAAGRFDDAIAEGQRTVQLDPSFFYLGSVPAMAYQEKGDFGKAITLYTKAQETTHSPSSGLAITYARMGRQAEARHILDQLLEKARAQYVAAGSIAGIYVALGENDEAFRWLERAYAEHDALLRSIGPSRTFRPLRADPRFADLLRRMGFDPAKILGQQKNQ